MIFRLLLCFSCIAGLMSACKRRSSEVKDAQGPCQVVNLGEHNDALSRALATNCDANPEKVLLSQGCINRGRALIAEKDMTQARNIDVFQCSPVLNESDQVDFKNAVFFSGPSPKELIATDDATGLHNFYKLEGATYSFQGDSFSKTNECRECHVYGELVMKELPDPWPNWLPRASVSDESIKSILGNDFNGNSRKPLTGIAMEGIVQKSIETTAEAFVARIKNDVPGPDSITLRDALKPVFCETGVTIISRPPSMPFDPKHLIYLPPARVIGLSMRYMMPGPQRKLAELPDGAQYAQDHGLEIPSAFGPNVTESKSKSVFVRHLEKQNILDESLTLAAAILDFPNALYSKRRCGILSKIPDVPMQNLPNGKAVNEYVLAELQGDSDPDVQEFVGDLKGAIEDLPSVEEKFTERVGRYLDKCRQENSAVQNIDKLYALYRAKLIPYLQKGQPLKHFVKLPIIEHFPGRANSPSSMFSEAQKLVDGVYAEQEGLGLTEDCQLNMEI
jgi:hypothetical protein